MSNTVWSFAGGYIDGSEMTQAEMDESLEAYGGTLQFTLARSCAMPASLPGRTRTSCSWSPSRMWRVPTAFTLSSKFVSSCLSDAMQISLALEL